MGSVSVFRTSSSPESAAVLSLFGSRSPLAAAARMRAASFDFMVEFCSAFAATFASSLAAAFWRDGRLAPLNEIEARRAAILKSFSSPNSANIAQDLLHH